MCTKWSLQDPLSSHFSCLFGHMTIMIFKKCRYDKNFFTLLYIMLMIYLHNGCQENHPLSYRTHVKEQPSNHSVSRSFLSIRPSSLQIIPIKAAIKFPDYSCQFGHSVYRLFLSIRPFSLQIIPINSYI